MNDPTRDLLAAVDALTEKDRVPMLRGNSHDHDWLELVRVLTRQERDEIKAANAKLPKKDRQKVPRTVKTGEWWCPFCEAVVAERPEEPAETINRRDDAPLLDQLEERVRGSLGDGGVKGANTGGSPIDIAAFGLRNRIDRDVRKWLKDLGASPGKNLTLAELLRTWHTFRLAGVYPVGEDDVFRVKLEGWETEIRDILDPPTQIPYMGQACPLCGETRAIKTIDAGNDVDEDTVALWAFLRPKYRTEGSYGLCRACGTVLARADDPITLRRKMNGTINGKGAFLAHSTTTGES
jgi:hypothetical protein